VTRDRHVASLDTGTADRRRAALERRCRAVVGEPIDRQAGRSGRPIGRLVVGRRLTRPRSVLPAAEQSRGDHPRSHPCPQVTHDVLLPPGHALARAVGRSAFAAPCLATTIFVSHALARVQDVAVACSVRTGAAPGERIAVVLAPTGGRIGIAARLAVEDDADLPRSAVLVVNARTRIGQRAVLSIADRRGRRRAGIAGTAALGATGRRSPIVWPAHDALEGGLVVRAGRPRARAASTEVDRDGAVFVPRARGRIARVVRVAVGVGVAIGVAITIRIGVGIGVGVGVTIGRRGALLRVLTAGGEATRC